MPILNIFLTVLSLALFILCLLLPLRKTKCGQCKYFRAMVKPHTLYACLLAVTAFAHGLLSGKNPGMVSGKIAWTVLIALLITSFLKKKLAETTWTRLHRVLSAAFGICVCVHIIYAIVF